jgi:cytochrome b561
VSASRLALLTAIFFNPLLVAVSLLLDQFHLLCQLVHAIVRRANTLPDMFEDERRSGFPKNMMP